MASVKDVCEFFWYLENERHLLHWQINGVYLWKVARILVYYAVTREIGFFEEPHPSKKYGPLRRLGWMTWGALAHNPFLNTKRTDYWVIPASRKIRGNDIYSHQLATEIQSQACSLEIQCPGFLRGESTYTLDFFITALFGVSKLQSRFVRNREIERQASIINEELNRRFGVRLEQLSHLLHRCYYRFVKTRALFKLLFKFKRPKRIFLVGCYFRDDLVAAAQDLGIPVTELQHGIMGRYHLGYSYPGFSDVPYFPDEILCFGSYWPESTDLPRMVKTRVIGAPYLNVRTDSERTRSNAILFVSQGVIGKPLLKFALSVARRIPEREVIFRLHPSEQLSDYQALLEAQKVPQNFRLSHEQPDIFELLASVEYQAGVFSTTLFEGMVLGAKVILINLPGVEYVTQLVAKNHAILVDTPEEFVQRFQAVKLVKDVSIYYSRPVSRICIDPN